MNKPRGAAFALAAAMGFVAPGVGAAVDDAESVAAPQVAITLSGEPTQGGWIKGKVPTGTAALNLDGVPVPVAPDGSFFAAFDRDAAQSATLTLQLRDGRSVTRTLTIAPRAWHIEHVDAPFRPPAIANDEYRRIRAGELARIGAARATITDALGWRQDFVWPVKGRISGRFGSQRVYRGTPGSYHSGIDIASGANGTPFVAPADGVVVLAASSPFTLEGNLLIIDHGAGLSSAFLHCSQLLVSEGERVGQGQLIGRIGMTGRATGPHLHWALRWRNARLDPLLFVGPMR